MIGEQHKRINLERRHRPARVDRPAEQRPGRVVTKESRPGDTSRAWRKTCRRVESHV